MVAQFGHQGTQAREAGARAEADLGEIIVAVTVIAACRVAPLKANREEKH